MHVFRLLGVVLLLGAASATAQTVDYDRSGDSVVLRYQEVIGGLAAEDPGPRVEVFGDGRVLVHYPDYMKQAGTYETRILQEEVDALVAEAVAGGVVDFDKAATETAIHEAQAQQRLRKRASGETILTDVSDPSTTVIEATVIPVGGKRAAKTVGSARWTGLARDAERYPEVKSLQDLATVEKKMRGLMQRDDLRQEK